MDVLFVASSGEPGGAELALETYLAFLPFGVRGHGLVLSGGPMASALAARLGRPVGVFDLPGRPSAARAVVVQRAVLRELRRLGPDVVLATGVKAATLCALPCRAARVPLVWHKVDFSRDGRLARPLSLLCAGVVPVSEAVAAAVPRRRTLATVAPPVRLDAGFRVGSGRPAATLGSVGRLVPYKGHADVVAAAGLLRERFADVRVVIAGGPDPSAPRYPDELATVARAHGMEDRVELLGHVPQVEDVLSRLTLLVQATYRDDHGFGAEGFGAAMAEASWAGLPVVVTTGGGAQDGMVDGLTGRLVAPRDPVAIAEAVAGYLADPAAARRAGEAGARLARERLAPDKLTSRLVDTLSDVALRGRGSGSATAGRRPDLR